MLSADEHAALAVFRSYKVVRGKMLCFHTPQLARHIAALRRLALRGLVVEEQFAGGFSMTGAGAKALRHAE